MKRKLIVLFSRLLMGGSLLASGMASAATVTWDDGEGDGSWNSATNWSSDTVPTVDDDVIIDTATVTHFHPSVGYDFGAYSAAGSLTVTDSTLSGLIGWARPNSTISFNNSSWAHASVVALNSLNAGSTFTLENGSAFSNAGEFWFGWNSGTRDTAASISIDSTSSFTLTGGGGASMFLWTDTPGGLGTSNYKIDFVGNGGTMSIGAAGIEFNNDNNKLSFEDLWDLGILTHNGTQSGLFGENFAVTGTMGSDGYTVTSIADPGQAPPVWSDPVVGVDGILGEAYADTLSGKATDPNGDIITYAYVSGPDWLNVASDGALTGTPNAGTGTNSFVVTATDLAGSGTSSTTTLEIVVYTQDPPTWSTNLLVRDDGVVDRAYTGSVAGEATDVNGDAITYSLESAPTWLSVSTNGVLSGTPLAEHDGLNTFTLGATDVDGSGLTSTTTLEITVTTPIPVNLTDWASLSASITGNVTTATDGWDFDGSAGVAYDYGEIDGGSNPTNGATIEYIVNLSDAGSSIAFGAMTSSEAQSMALKLEQWPNTGKFGITLPGVADVTMATDSVFSHNVHVVFVRQSDGSMDLYVDGALLENNTDRSWRMDGGAGWLGSTAGGTADVPVGTIYGVASYSNPLDAGTIADLYDAYINGAEPALPVSVMIDGPISGGTEMIISWTGAAFTTYSVETNSSLILSDNWSEFVGGITGEEGELHAVTNTITGADETFYRVQSQK